MFCTIGHAQVNGQLKIDKSEIHSDKTNGFDILNWKSHYKTIEIGKPELPVYRVSYVLPVDAVVTGVSFKNKSKQKLDGSFYLYPVQEPIPTDNSKDVKFTVPDSEVYESNQPYPNNIYEIESDRFLQGYHIITLIINPFEYIPKSRTLNYYTDLDYTIQYTLGGNVDEIKPLTQTVLRSEQCNSFVKSLVQNPDNVDIFGSNALSLREGKNTVQKSSTAVQKISSLLKTKALSVEDEIVPDYIIITCDSLKATFQTLADWKTKKGVYTIIKTTEEIASAYSGIDLPEKIRKYIIDAYTRWGAGLYVLLGGDTNIVPARMVLGDNTILRPSDRYFASYKGTWNDNGDNVYLDSGDIMTTDISVILGRAPVENKKEAAVFNKKVISYEKADSIPSTKLNYFNNYLFLDEFLGYNNNGILDDYGCRNAIQTNNNTYLPGNIIRKYIYDNHTCSNIAPYSSANCVQGDIELNRLNFISCLNNGANLIPNGGKFHFIYEMSHCSPGSIGTSSIDKHEYLIKDDVNQLANGNYYQIFMSSGCEPADFSEDCIAERYLNNPNGGGVAFIGNSDQGSSGDTTQCMFIFQAFFNNKLYNIGNAFEYIRNAADYSYGFPYYKYKNDRRLHLLGDPEMPVWTNTPQALIDSVTPTAILIGNQTDTVTLSNLPLNVKALICIQKGTEVFTTQQVTGTGSIMKIPMNFTVDTPGTVNVTVTAHNYLPSEKTITANQTPAPNLYISTVDFGDGIVSGTGIGNGDGLNDAGETISLGLGIKNTGVNQANGVTATLNCNSSLIKIKSNQVNIGSLASGVTSTGIFSYKIDSLAPEKRANDTIPVQFSLAIKDVNNVIWKDTFNIDIFNSEIRQGNKSMVYISHNHTTIAANDTVRFKIDLKNIGNAPATGIKATLTGNSSYIQSCSGTSLLYPTIGHSEVKQDSVPFQFVTSGAYSSGNDNLGLLAFKLKVENTYGKVWNYNFDLSKPPKVTGLDFTADTTEINVTWNYSTAYSGYNIYRCSVDSATEISTSDYVKVNTDSITFGYFIDKNLGKLTKYRYKVSAISESGNEGYLSDSLLAWTSISKKVFPISLPNQANATTEGGITVADINNDGYKEIFGATKGGYIIGLDHNGNELYNIDGNVTTQGGYATMQSEVHGTPAVGDLHGTGQSQLVDASRNQSINRLYCFSNNDTNHNYNPDTLFVKDLPNGNLTGTILSNIDNSPDGSLELVTVCENGQITIHDANGTLRTTIKDGISLDSKLHGYYRAIAVADLDGNGFKEIIKADSTCIYIFNQDGNPYKNKIPFYTLPSGSGLTFMSSVIVCNIDNKGGKEILATATSGSTGKIYAIRTDTISTDPIKSLVSGWNTPTITTNGNISVGDLNHDGELEIVTLGTNTVNVLSNTDSLLYSTTIVNLSPSATPIIADIDGDSDDEIIFSSTNGLNKNVYALKMNLTKVMGFPIKTTFGSGYSTPCVSDIDNDGKNELIVGDNTWIEIWKTNGKAGNIEWGCDRQNQYNTGEYQTVCAPLTISSSETWSTNHEFCSDLTIKSGTLTLTNSNLTMGNSNTITVMSGASLIIDSGNIQNANVRAMAGSSVTIKNNGSIKLRSNGEFYTETGTIVDFPNGSIGN
jgi:hypothetical protein